MMMRRRAHKLREEEEEDATTPARSWIQNVFKNAALSSFIRKQIYELSNASSKYNWPSRLWELQPTLGSLKIL